MLNEWHTHGVVVAPYSVQGILDLGLLQVRLIRSRNASLAFRKAENCLASASSKISHISWKFTDCDQLKSRPRLDDKFTMSISIPLTHCGHAMVNPFSIINLVGIAGQIVNICAHTVKNLREIKNQYDEATNTLRTTSLLMFQHRGCGYSGYNMG
jgi:hypothetical protein